MWRRTDADAPGGHQLTGDHSSHRHWCPDAAGCVRTRARCNAGRFRSRQRRRNCAHCGARIATASSSRSARRAPRTPPARGVRPSPATPSSMSYCFHAPGPSSAANTPAPRDRSISRRPRRRRCPIHVFSTAFHRASGPSRRGRSPRCQSRLVSTRRAVHRDGPRRTRCSSGHRSPS